MEKKLHDLAALLEQFERDTRNLSMTDQSLKADGMARYVVSRLEPGEVHRLLGLINPYPRFAFWRGMFFGCQMINGAVYGREPARVKKRLSLQDIDKLVGRGRDRREPHQLERLVDNRV